MATTSIEWTEKTWNPTRGCSLTSPGCKNCYAMTMAHRFSGKGQPYEGLTRMTTHGPVWTGEVRPVPEMLDYPLHLRKPQSIFVNSMSDLFHENVSMSFVMQVFAVMSLAQQHTFQILTKRAERMRAILTARGVENWIHDCLQQPDWLLPGRSFPRVIPQWPLSHVQLGVSVENQEAKYRIDILREIPAAIRFLSLEPLLEDLGELDLRGIDWVIVGGESGPNARPIHPDWVRSIRDQCLAVSVPFFFKQRGGWTWDKPESFDFTKEWGVMGANGQYFSRCSAWNGKTGEDSEGHEVYLYHVGKKAAGSLLDGREWKEFP